ncbi:MAG: CPBP family intramembrane metalloprotease [Candidatus Marinimicrobia bacterium]|nr:CPBP family intramembrane metalloprotease [Candidatus Neomarinimicrobiota bacterium]
MTRKPIFWIVFIILFIGSVFFGLNYFSKAYPIVSLDLEMDRSQALQKAEELAHKYDWGPDNFKQAAAFQLDREVKNFVELEHGGSSGFRQLLDNKMYSPYQWKIRLYKPGKTNETLVRLTPDGRAYGFREKIPEDQPGNSLSLDSALTIARNSAKSEWQVNLNEYDLVEKSHELKPEGRLDYTFVYERKNASLGQGKYRLRLKVSGASLTELTHFVKVPEAFSRHYTEMRSTNQTIATIAMVAMAILYIIGGCIIGLFLLMKDNWVLWRKALIWGAIVAIFQVLSQINQWPLAWMNYDTALAAQSFIIQQIVQLIILFIGEWLLLSASFMAAESLTRKAFPEHVQFWKVWSKDVASTKGILGQTMGGYLAVGIFLAFDIALYFFATSVLGWWVPSESLFEPNILATYFPWLSSIANSLHAGFWEECLFRAVPIAGAALLGERYGRKKVWIAAAFVVQALVFGAAHASYPMQPAYARVVELIIPSFAFGLIYLKLGLLPAIVLHYAFDVVFMSMPLFAASSSGIWIDRIIVIVLTLLPLLIVLWRRLQVGEFHSIPDSAYNAAWQPSVEESEIEEKQIEEAQEPESETISHKRYHYVIIAGIVGLVVWFFTANFNNQAPRVKTTRSQAQKIAQKALAEKGVEPSDSIRILTSLQIPLGQDDRFIWQEEGQQLYKKLLGKYLSTPVWQVRFAQFEGDVARRAEEYRVYIKNQKVINIEHKLPESYPGARLELDSARAIAHSVLEDEYDLEPEKLEEVAAKPSELPARKDWEFKYADTLNYQLSSGQPRIVINIAGSEVVDSYRKIYIPEEWERRQRSKETTRRIIAVICGIGLFLLMAVALVVAIIRWSRKSFAVKPFLIIVIFLFVLGLIQFVNSFPSMTASFSTAQPFSSQVFTAIAFPLIGILLLAGAIAIIFSFIITWKPQQKDSLDVKKIGAGLAAGFIVAGFVALSRTFLTSEIMPLWAEFSALDNWLPFLAAGSSPVQGFIAQTTIFMLLFTAISRFSQNWSKRKILFGLLLIAVVFILNGLSLQTINYWLVSGLATGLIYLVLYIYLIRHHLALVPLVIGGTVILGIIKQIAFNAYPAAIFGNMIALVMIIAISIYGSKMLE